MPLDWTEMRTLKGGETQEPTGAPTMGPFIYQCHCKYIPGTWYSTYVFDIGAMIEKYCGSRDAGECAKINKS